MAVLRPMFKTLTFFVDAQHPMRKTLRIGCWGGKGGWDWRGRETFVGDAFWIGFARKGFLVLFWIGFGVAAHSPAAMWILSLRSGEIIDLGIAAAPRKGGGARPHLFP